MKKLLALAFLLSSVACTSTGHLRAYYTVPAPESLARYAKFDLKEVRFNRDSKGTTVAYTLPRELTGVENRVEFTGEGAVLTGAHGKMTCPAKGDLSNCDVRYKDLKFNEAERAEIIKSVSKTPEEIKQRVLVAMAFMDGGEPHGILQIPDYADPKRGGYKGD